MKPASPQLTRAVGRDVERLLQRKLDSLLQKVADSPIAQERLQELAARLEKLNVLAGSGASLENIARAGRSVRDAIKSTKSEASTPPGLDDWLKTVTTELEDVVLLAAMNDAIADVLTDGAEPAAGPAGPGGLAPGGDGPDPDPGPGGPDDLAPGGDGPDPDPGPEDSDGGFDLDIDVHLWFGHGDYPIICYPQYPLGHCCWIGDTILVCGTGGSGNTYVMYGSAAYAGLPLPSVEPIGDAPADAEYAERILLLNPEANSGPVHYVLDQMPFVMEAGMMQDVRLETTVIRFTRGPGLGEARYTLRPGSYRFVVTEQGWDLVKATFRATLDNTANAADFQLVLDGELVTISGRSSKEVTSPYPLLVEFDDGDGNEPARKQLSDGKTYTIGINQDTELWDLFQGDAVASNAGKAEDVRLIASAGLLFAPSSIAVPATTFVK